MQDGVISEKKGSPEITQIQNRNPNLQDSRELKISFGNDNLWMDLEGQIIIDVAWRDHDRQTSVAWILTHPSNPASFQCSHIFKAYSPLQVETIACYRAVLRAIQTGWRIIRIFSNCLVLTQALCPKLIIGLGH